uniref:IST1 homolog n=1 Tax=Cacopsylla melanoneura TaxID=428564 RepID=A0A8D8UU49_9HEMI
MFSSKPKYSKLKTNFRLVVNRLQLKGKKKAELAQKSRKEIADFIANNKVERARIKVEQIIREDYLVEAIEMLENYCEILISRFGLLENSNTVDPSLAEAISSLIWVTPRLEAEIKELKEISAIFGTMYGKQYIDAVKQEAVETISEKLKHKMGIQPPPKILVEKYLIEIAKNYEVPYTPDAQIMLEDSQSKGIDALLFDNISNPGNLPPRPPGFVGYPQPPMVPMQQPFAYPNLPHMHEEKKPDPSQPPFSYNTPTRDTNFPASYSYDFPPGEKPIAPPSPGVFNYSPPPKYDDSMRSDSLSSIGGVSDLPGVPRANGGSQAPPKPVPSPRTSFSPSDPVLNLPNVPSDTMPDPGEAPVNNSDNDIDFDDLTKRFEDLKKKR